MTEGTSLEELLNADTSPEPETVTEPEESPARPRDENGRFAAKQTGVEPETVDEQEPDAVPPTDKLPQEEYKAIKQEREKRQSLEQEVEALRKQIQQFQQQNQEPPAPPPSLWEDEEGWQHHLQSQVLQQADQLSRINASEMAARTQHPDFQDMYDLFNQMAAQNPAIVQQAMADPHPWGKAYQIAKSYKSMQELGAVDVNDLREKLKAELMAELSQGQSPVQESQRLPATLTGERSVASRSGPSWAGPTPLTDLLR